MPAPSVRYALGEAFGLAPGSVTTGKMLAALKQLGFSHCWDTEFAADVTIWEEASEFVERLGAKRDLPQFTSCCPGWQKYAETFYPDLLPHFSSCKSPVAMIVSTRESKAVREKVLPLGISQISGGSRTSVGGYYEPEPEEDNSAQFDVSDRRTLDEVVGWLMLTMPLAE